MAENASGTIVPVNELAFAKVVRSTTVVDKLAGGFGFVEGPSWTEEDGGYLVFSDIPNNRIHRWSMREGVTIHREPRFDDEPVARQATFAAQQGERRDVAMPGPQAAVGQQQLQQHGLADERLQRQVRVYGRRMQLDAPARGNGRVGGHGLVHAQIGRAHD